MDDLVSIFETVLAILDKVDTLVTVMSMVVSVICTLVTWKFTSKAKSYKEFVLHGFAIEELLTNAQNVKMECEKIMGLTPNNCL